MENVNWLTVHMFPWTVTWYRLFHILPFSQATTIVQLHAWVQNLADSILPSHSLCAPSACLCASLPIIDLTPPVLWLAENETCRSGRELAVYDNWAAQRQRGCFLVVRWTRQLQLTQQFNYCTISSKFSTFILPSNPPRNLSSPLSNSFHSHAKTLTRSNDSTYPIPPWSLCVSNRLLYLVPFLWQKIGLLFHMAIFTCFFCTSFMHPQNVITYSHLSCMMEVYQNGLLVRKSVCKNIHKYQKSAVSMLDPSKYFSQVYSTFYTPNQFPPVKPCPQTLNNQPWQPSDSHDYLESRDWRENHRSAMYTV